MIKARMRAPLAAFSAIVLSGCVGLAEFSPTPATPASATPALATAAPRQPTPPPSTMRPSPSAFIATPAPTSLGPDDAVSLFVSRFAFAPPTYHVRCSVYLDFFPGPVTSHDPEMSSILVVGDTDGEDFSGWYGSMGETIDVIYVDRVGYMRTPAGEWERPRGFELAMDPNPFYWLVEDHVAHHGIVSRVGRRLHHMSASVLPGFDPYEWMTDADWRDLGLGWTKMRGIEVQSSTFDFYVQDDGMPTEAIQQITLVGTVDGEEARLVISSTYLFSEYGKDVTIEAPDVSNPG